MEQADKLADDLVVCGPPAVALHVRAQDQRKVAVLFPKQCVRRHVVVIALVLGLEGSGTQVAERQPPHRTHSLLRI